MTHVLDMFTSVQTVHLLVHEETESAVAGFSFIFFNLLQKVSGSLTAAVICMQLTSIPAKNNLQYTCSDPPEIIQQAFKEEKWFLVL